QGAIQGTPALAQASAMATRSGPSTASSGRTVAVLRLRRERAAARASPLAATRASPRAPLPKSPLAAAARPSAIGSPVKSSSTINAGELQHRAHALGGELGIDQDAGLVGQPEQLREVQDAAGALQPGDHAEVVLEAVEVGE